MKATACTDASPNLTKTTYVYDTFGQLAAEYGGASSSTGTEYLTEDHLGSSRLVTDASGAVKRRYDYVPFGEQLDQTHNGRSAKYGSSAYPVFPPDGQPLKFTSKERDAETGLDFFGARYMSAAQGRFTSPDPLLNSGRPWDPQSWNRYAYTRNNPLRYVDPTGMYDWAASGCESGDKDCEKRYKAQQREFKDALSYLKRARDSFDKKSAEYKRLNAALAAYGKEGDHNGVTVGFKALNAEGQTDPVGDARSYNVFFDPAKMGADAKRFASSVGHEGTHVDDFRQMLGGASVLSPFSQEYRGYETSAFVFQGLFTPSISTSPGTILGGVSSYNLQFRGIEIWNTSWSAADAPKLRDAAITNVVTGLDTKHPETVPHDPWR